MFNMAALWSPEVRLFFPCQHIHGDMTISMAMQQDPIDWRYLLYHIYCLPIYILYIYIYYINYIYILYYIYIYISIRPIFQGISPENMARNMVRLRTSINWTLKFPLTIPHDMGWSNAMKSNLVSFLQGLA